MRCQLMSTFQYRHPKTRADGTNDSNISFLTLSQVWNNESTFHNEGLLQKGGKTKRFFKQIMYIFPSNWFKNSASVYWAVGTLARVNDDGSIFHLATSFIYLWCNHNSQELELGDISDHLMLLQIQVELHHTSQNPHCICTCPQLQCYAMKCNISILIMKDSWRISCLGVIVFLWFLSRRGEGRHKSPMKVAVSELVSDTNSIFLWRLDQLKRTDHNHSQVSFFETIKTINTTRKTEINTDTTMPHHLDQMTSQYISSRE